MIGTSQISFRLYEYHELPISRFVAYYRDNISLFGIIHLKDQWGYSLVSFNYLKMRSIAKY